MRFLIGYSKNFESLNISNCLKGDPSYLNDEPYFKRDNQARGSNESNKKKTEDRKIANKQIRIKYLSNPKFDRI